MILDFITHTHSQTHNTEIAPCSTVNCGGRQQNTFAHYDLVNRTNVQLGHMLRINVARHRGIVSDARAVNESVAGWRWQNYSINKGTCSVFGSPWCQITPPLPFQGHSTGAKPTSCASLCWYCAISKIDSNIYTLRLYYA